MMAAGEAALDAARAYNAAQAASAERKYQRILAAAALPAVVAAAAPDGAAATPAPTSAAAPDTSAPAIASSMAAAPADLADDDDWRGADRSPDHDSLLDDGWW